MGKIIGIDLGTTNSAVAVYDGQSGEIIANLDGDRTTPSIVAFTDDGEILVGQQAKRQAVTNPHNTFYAIKRLIGLRYDDEEVAKLKENVPFEIIEAENGDAWISVKGKPTAPAEIGAQVLKALKEAAESFLGEEVTEAVITVPAYFNDAQRQATQDAGAIAGLDVKRIINEPTAAALAYGLNKEEDKNIIVYDLGGGTFDVSVLNIGKVNGKNVIEVEATNGDTFLGGEDFDNRLINYIADEVKKNDGFDVRANQMSLQRVKEAAEDAKKALSTAQSYDINLPFLGMKDDGQPYNLAMKVTRDQFEDLVRDLVEKSIAPCEKALEDAGLTMADIDEVLLVGGMTRMPLVQETVKNVFGKDPNKGVNPDEVVASGAAVQGAIISKDVTNVLLVDVTPLSLGVEGEGGQFFTIVEAQTAIPTQQTMKFSNAEDGQTGVTVKIGQGESAQFKNNNQLGEFQLDGIPPLPRGQAEIEITLDVDANGVLSVTAKELTTGKEANITVKANGGLTEEQVEEMRKKAEATKEEDQQFQKAIDLKNQASSIMSEAPGVEKEDWYTGASDSAKSAFQNAVDGVKTALESEDTSKLETSVEAYNKAKTDLGQSFAEEAKKKQAATAANSDTPDTSAEAETKAENTSEQTAPTQKPQKPKGPGSQ